MKFIDWLAQLKEGDLVVPVIHGERKDPVSVTRATATQITIGKYAKRTRFNRKTGVICGSRPLKHLFRIEQP